MPIWERSGSGSGGHKLAAELLSGPDGPKPRKIIKKRARVRRGLKDKNSAAMTRWGVYTILKGKGGAREKNHSTVYVSRFQYKMKGVYIQIIY